MLASKLMAWLVDAFRNAQVACVYQQQARRYDSQQRFSLAKQGFLVNANKEVAFKSTHFPKMYLLGLPRSVCFCLAVSFLHVAPWFEFCVVFGFLLHECFHVSIDHPNNCSFLSHSLFISVQHKGSNLQECSSFLLECSQLFCFGFLWRMMPKHKRNTKPNWPHLVMINVGSLSRMFLFSCVANFLSNCHASTIISLVVCFLKALLHDNVTDLWLKQSCCSVMHCSASMLSGFGIVGVMRPSWLIWGGNWLTHSNNAKSWRMWGWWWLHLKAAMKIFNFYCHDGGDCGFPKVPHYNRHGATLIAQHCLREQLLSRYKKHTTPKHKLQVHSEGQSH